MILAAWLLSLPFRFLAALGLRRSVILACLFVLAVTAYGVAEDLGVLDPPARAAPARRPAGGQPPPSRAATTDIPADYLRLYRAAGARYRIPWPVLAAIGKVESDHGRVRLPGVRSGSNWAGACGPMQIGCVPGSKAGNAWARYGRGLPHDPAAAIPAAARYLVDHGARHHLDRALYAYNHSWAYVAKVKASPAGMSVGVGAGERPDRPPPGPRAGLDQAAGGGLLRDLWGRTGPPPQRRLGPTCRPPPPLPSLRHPQQPPAARDDQPGRRPRPGPRPAGTHRPPLATCPLPRPRPPCWKEVSSPMSGSPTWLTASQAAARLQVSAKTVTRWANQGRLQHQRTLGGHRRFDPELIDALVHALTYRP